ncbi:MAG: nicotinate phosphoribosyltransferase [Armatimonadia bacterium]|nr:nicotinate phosphoribosyltransferase [Armatimonadia bacterium]
MSRFNGERLAPEIFKLDAERMRTGWYSDKYFVNIQSILTTLSDEGYRLESLHGELDVGNMEVEMQIFARREPVSIVCGIDKAIAMLKECAGLVEDGRWMPAWDRLEVDAAKDGDRVEYDGHPTEVTPVMRIRGRYRDFSHLETPMLGALTRGTKIATNVFHTVAAARGKEVLFFPARFDAHEVQASDGYSYQIGVQAYNQWARKQVPPRISTDAQGDWWGADGGGTIAHAAIACFLGDIVPAMLAFARTRPVEVPRIALVDFTNDCVGETLRLMEAMFKEWATRMEDGRQEEADRYVLYAVRADTSGSLRDESVEPLGDKDLDNGVCPRLVYNLRQAMDRAWHDWDIPETWVDWAARWCAQVKVVVTGGFTPERITLFEKLGVPADIYGVGSSLLWTHKCDGSVSDYTADVVRVKLNGDWVPMAKVGRRPCDNPAMERVT